MAINPSTSQRVRDWFNSYNLASPETNDSGILGPNDNLSTNTGNIGTTANGATTGLTPPVKAAPLPNQPGILQAASTDGNTYGPNGPYATKSTGATSTDGNTYGPNGPYGPPSTGAPSTNVTPSTDGNTYGPNGPYGPPSTGTGTPAVDTPAVNTPAVNTPAVTTPAVTTGTPATTTTTATTTGNSTGGILNPDGSTTIDPNALHHRVIDPATETVAGQQNILLSGNNPYIQGFRDRAVREANRNGLANSTMAATAGEEAAAQASLPVATSDAGAYNTAANYNTALDNQGLMYNVDQHNQFQLQANRIAGQKAIAEISAASAQGVAGINAAAQLSAASLSAETARFNAQLSSDTSRYNTDTNYRIQQDQQQTTLINNIMNNMDMSPDRKAELLKAMGRTDLANAIYVPDPELDMSNGGFHPGQVRTIGGQRQIWNNGKWEVIQ